MSTFTAVLIIAILLMVTLLVGIASQLHGKSASPEPGARSNAAPPPQPGRARSHDTEELEEDLDALHESIEAARSELVWLREQVARERARLERVRRQGPSTTRGRPGAPTGAGAAG